MILRRTLLKALASTILTASAKAQSGIPGCGAGVPTTNAFGNGMGMPGGCAPGVPVTSDPLLQLLNTLKASTVWSKLTGFYVFAQPTAAAAVQNLKSPGTLDLVATNSPTFSTNVGFSGDGVSAHLLGPAFSSITGYTTNSHSAGVFSLNTQKTSSIGIMATDTSSQAFGMASADTSRQALTRSASTTSDALPAANSGICHVGYSRSAAGSYAQYTDRMKSLSSTSSVSVPSAAKLTLLRAATTYTLNQVGAAWIGAAITDAEYAALDSALETYLRRVGAYSQVRGSDGVWTWFNDPRVISISGVPVVGAITSNGSPVVLRDNATTGLTERAVLKNIMLTDDHCNPGIIRSSVTGKIVAAYNKHNDPSMFCRISSNADDVTTFAAEVDLASQIGNAGATNNFAYANFVELTGESNKLYLIFRATTSAIWTLHWATSTDGGATWGTATRLLWDGRPYWKAKANGANRIDFICNDQNPGDATYTYCNTYHFYYQGGSFFKSDGTSAGTLPLLQSGPTKIYDSQASGIDSWVWDLKIFGGNPVACFVVLNSSTDHRYHQARWNGSSWVDREICLGGGRIYSGQPQYSGGLAQDANDINTVYCSRQVDNNGNPVGSGGTFQLFKYVTADSGVTWTGTQLTFGSDNCLRPYVAEGVNYLFYFKGRYTTYLDYQTTIEKIAI